MKIAFVSSNDITDRKSLSGSLYLYLSFLRETYGEVDLIHQFRPNRITLGYLVSHLLEEFTWIIIAQKIRELYWRLLGRAFVWEKTEAVSRYYGREIGRRIAGKKYDFILTEKGSFCTAFLETDTPIVYATDATFGAMENYYPEFMNPAPSFSREGNLVEQAALDKASLIIVTNHWAADSMKRRYGINPDKIRIIVHPGLAEPLSRVTEPWEAPEDGVCRLLLVGVDWTRKGGEIAVQALDWLNQNGIPTRLTVCGCVVPEQHRAHPYLDVAGFLDNNTESGRLALNRLFESSHFMILPTRAECCGQVFIESAAYGLPSIGTDTGGVASGVFEGKSGYLLDLAADGSAYGACIKNLWTNPFRYAELRVSTREIYEKYLGLDVWKSSIKAALSKCGWNGVAADGD